MIGISQKCKIKLEQQMLSQQKFTSKSIILFEVIIFIIKLIYESTLQPLYQNLQIHLLAKSTCPLKKQTKSPIAWSFKYIFNIANQKHKIIYIEYKSYEISSYYKQYKKNSHSTLSTIETIQFTFLQPYRKIHKNASFDDKIRCQREKQNDRFAKRLCNSSCLITSIEETQKQYLQHLSYKQIVRRYDEENRRKNLIVLGNISTLTHSNIKRYGDSKLQLCTLANSNKSKQKQSTYRQRYKNNYFVRSKGVKQPQRKVIKLF